MSPKGLSVASLGWLLFGFALLAAGAGRAAAEAGRTGGMTLARPLGARAVGMGEAFSAIDGGLDSLTYNAGGMTGLKGGELRSDYTHGIVDDSFSFLGYGHRLGAAVLVGGLEYYDAGSINLNLSDGTTGRRKVEQDWVGVAGGSYDAGAGLSVGGVIKPYRFSLAEAAQASGAAFDLGGRWASPLRGLSFGAAAQNLGKAVKFEQDSDPLPTTVRGGAAYALDIAAPTSDTPISIDRIVLAVDGIAIRQERPALATGFEMRMPLGAPDFFAAMRLGYQFNSEVNGLSVGVGFREGRFILDYSLGAERQLGNAHHFSLGVRL